jgi:hypothetical protein
MTFKKSSTIPYFSISKTIWVVRFLDPIIQIKKKTGVVACGCNLSTWEVMAGGLLVWDQPGVMASSQANLGDRVRPPPPKK